MTQPISYPTRPGRTESCCPGMKMALHCRWIKKGFIWRKFNPPRWIPWSLNLESKNWVDKSDIAFCPWCGTELRSPDEV